MRDINVSEMNDHDFLGIVELPTVLECRGKDLYKILNSAGDGARAHLNDFLDSLDPRDLAITTTYLERSRQ